MTRLEVVEISGLADPTYNSGGANKSYVDTISGTIVTWATDAFPISANYLIEDEADALYVPTGTVGDISGTITLSSGLTVDSVSIWHDGPVTQMYLDDIPQGVLKSGANYYKAYESGQISLYDIIDDTTPQLGGDLDLNSHIVSGLGAGLQLHPSGLILSHFTGSGGSWPGGDSPPLGLLFISGS